MFKIMKGYKIFAFTPSGKSLKKTLMSGGLQKQVQVQLVYWLHYHKVWYELVPSGIPNHTASC